MIKKTQAYTDDKGTLHPTWSDADEANRYDAIASYVSKYVSYENRHIVEQFLKARGAEIAPLLTPNEEPAEEHWVPVESVKENLHLPDEVMKYNADTLGGNFAEFGANGGTGAFRIALGENMTWSEETITSTTHPKGIRDVINHALGEDDRSDAPEATGTLFTDTERLRLRELISAELASDKLTTAAAMHTLRSAYGKL